MPLEPTLELTADEEGLASRDPQPSSRLIGGRFELESLEASGGMGNVFRARDRLAGQPVALKMVRSLGRCVDERFNRETALLTHVQHPGVVRYVAHGVTAAGAAYLAMEWIDGETLEARLAPGPLTLHDTIALGRRLLSALGALHRAGIVHRDLKPANIMLSDGDVCAPKIIDLGIARHVAASGLVTATGDAPGTPMYMAPEQARGDAHVDERADLFSLGCVLFECLSGRRLFAAETYAALQAKVCAAETAEALAQLSEIPPAVVTLLGRMLARNPADRPADVDSLADELGAINLGPAPATDRPAVPTFSAREERRVAFVLLVKTNDPAGDPRTISDLLSGFGACVQTSAPCRVEGAVAVTFRDWGAPTDQALRAARAALTLHRERPRWRIALSFGPVAGGTAPGDEVRARGAALLASQRPGVFTDAVTATLLASRFVISGRTRLRVAREKADGDLARTVLGKHLPFVGRNRELSALEALFAECVEESVARVALVTAPAGAGKSRLQHELIERLRARDQDFEVLIGRGDPMRAGAPFGLIAPAIRRGAHIVEGEPAAARSARLLAHVQRRVDREHAPRVAAFLGQIADVHFADDEPLLRAAREDVRSMADQMLAGWLDWLGAESASCPVVLVLDDVHWGDAASVQFVDAALRALAHRPFFVLAMARPELDSKFPNLWAERDVQRVRLPPLRPAACAKLISSVLGDLPPTTLDWIVERADGNPFYLEELVRGVGNGLPAGPGAMVPETVLGMVQARFDALGPDARKVVRAASVFGQSFRATDVKAVLAHEEAHRLEEWLDILLAREVLSVRSGGPTRLLAFRHALLREAAYEMIPESDRRRAHRLAGEQLERAGERDAILLVEHFERGGDATKAAAWSPVAAEQALEANDLASVLERVARGVRSGAAGETLGRLRAAESQARYWLSDFAASEAAARAALDCLHGSARFRVVGELVAILGRQSRYDELSHLVERLSDDPERRVSVDGWCVAVLRAAGFLLSGGGRQDLARQVLDWVEEERRESPAVRARVSQLRGILARCNGLLYDGIVHFEDALRCFEQIGDIRESIVLLNDLGAGFADTGMLEAAEQRLSRALMLGERLGTDTVNGFAFFNLALVHGFGGRILRAKEAAEQARAHGVRLGELRLAGGAELYLALCAVDDGKPALALHQVEEAMAKLNGVPMLRGWTLGVMARVLLALGRPSEALQRAQEANSLLESLAVGEEGEALVRLVFAEALFAVGLADSARSALGRARDRLRERARSLPNEEWRKAFLERIPEHKRTMALAAELL